MALCVAVAHTLAAVLPISAFVLAWTHSVEKTEWQESWRIEEGRLLLLDASIGGSGAGMEPPPGAVLIDNRWHYQPEVAPMPRLMLAGPQFGQGYRLCWDGSCRPLAELLPPRSVAPIELYPCEGAPG